MWRNVMSRGTRRFIKIYPTNQTTNSRWNFIFIDLKTSQNALDAVFVTWVVNIILKCETAARKWRQTYFYDMVKTEVCSLNRLFVFGKLIDGENSWDAIKLWRNLHHHLPLCQSEVRRFHVAVLVSKLIPMMDV